MRYKFYACLVAVMVCLGSTGSASAQSTEKTTQPTFEEVFSGILATEAASDHRVTQDQSELDYCRAELDHYQAELDNTQKNRSVELDELRWQLDDLRYCLEKAVDATNYEDWRGLVYEIERCQRILN